MQALIDRAVGADFGRVRQDTHEAIEDGHGRHEERYVLRADEDEDEGTRTVHGKTSR